MTKEDWWCVVMLLSPVWVLAFIALVHRLVTGAWT